MTSVVLYILPSQSACVCTLSTFSPSIQFLPSLVFCHIKQSLLNSTFRHSHLGPLPSPSTTCSRSPPLCSLYLSPFFSPPSSILFIPALLRVASPLPLPRHSPFILPFSMWLRPPPSSSMSQPPPYCINECIGSPLSRTFPDLMS